MASLHLMNAMPASVRVAIVHPACKLPFLRGFHNVYTGIVGIQRVKLTTTGPSEQPSAGTENPKSPNVEASPEIGVKASLEGSEKQFSEAGSESEYASQPAGLPASLPASLPAVSSSVSARNINGKGMPATKAPNVLESIFASSEGPKPSQPPSLWGKRGTNRPEKSRQKRGMRGIVSTVSTGWPVAPKHPKLSASKSVRSSDEGLKTEKGKKSSKIGGTLKEKRQDSGSSVAEKNFSEQFVIDRLQDVVKSCKKELSRVGTESDEDVIHDLRVQLRRLRSALRMFAPLIGTPLKISSLSDLLRSLGRVRDTDVQQEVLSSVTKSAKNISQREQARVDTTFVVLKNARSKLTTQASAAIRSKKTNRLIAGLEAWLENPKIASTSSEEGVGLVVPSLLTPHAASLFLHPGWHLSSVANELQGVEGSPDFQTPPKWTARERKRGECLHDLRKHMRELRYHLELLEVAYKGSTDYIEVVNRIQSLQRLLGNLQDLQVLALLLQKRHGSLKKMPALAVAIYKQYWEVWTKWKDTFSSVGSAAGQEKLYCTVLKEVSAPA